MFKMNFFKKPIKEAQELDASLSDGFNCNPVKNYGTLDNGDIMIEIGDKDERHYFNTYYIEIKKNNIYCIDNNLIVYTSEENRRNEYYDDLVENKLDLITWNEIYKINMRFNESTDYWYEQDSNLMDKTSKVTTPIKTVFEETFKSKYKLIENNAEFDDYISSTISCDDWCRLKLVNKMKELGLVDGFINSFADLIGNDLDKYHQMIDLANECNDRDTLMYMYTYKFGGEK